jgi:phage-related protein (TIGR01555 family)
MLNITSLVSALPVRAVRRVDGWINTLTGLGASLTDKVTNTQPLPFLNGLGDDILSDLFHSDATVRKAVMKKPEQALRLGARINLPDDAGGHKAATELQDAFDDLFVIPHFIRACTWEQLYGGAAIFVAVDDGNYALDSQATPLNLSRLRRVLWLRTIPRTRIRASTSPLDIDMDEASETFGEPLIYELDVLLGSERVRIHRSRLILFPGIVTSDEVRRNRGGWGISILDPTFDSLQRNATAWASAAAALANAQYVVYKLKGLAQMFSMSDGEAKAKSRARAMEIAKSMINAVLIDSEDEYIRENPNFGNMPLMLDQMMLDASGQLDMPATVLWGRSPAGMNATGESDIELWHESCDAYREFHIRPRLHQVVELLMAQREGPTKGVVHDGWRVVFPPLRQLTESQRADVRAKTSQADAIDITSGILLPQEVALSRFRPEGYSIETQIDLELREKLQRFEVEQRERDMREPPPEPPPAFAPPPGAEPAPAQPAEAAE